MRKLILISIVFVLFFKSNLAFANTENYDYSVVHVTKIYEEVLRVDGPGITVGIRNYKGSGFFIAKDLILTNYHVVRPTEYGKNFKYRISFSKNNLDLKNEYEAEIVSFDKDHDLAILKIKDKKVIQKSKPLEFISFQESANIDLTENFTFLGFPTKFNGELTQTIAKFIDFNSVSPLDEKGKLYLTYENAARFNGKIFLGNSGGPVVDENGKVISVSSFSDGENGGSNAYGTNPKDLLFFVSQFVGIDGLATIVK